jgi:hypothetical protein
MAWGGAPAYWVVDLSTWVTPEVNSLADALISNSLGQSLSEILTYTPLTNSSVYTKYATAIYPVQDIQSPMYVVSSVSSSNGIGGTNVTNYNYVGAKSHLRGGGFLGFRQMKTTDAQTGISTTTTYGQGATCVATGQADSAYPYCLYNRSLPLSMERRTSGNGLLTQIINTWDNGLNTAVSPQYHAPTLKQKVESTYELASSGTGAPIVTTTSCNTYDGYGNPTTLAVWSAAVDCAALPAKTGKHVKETSNSYTNDLVNWYLGRLTGSVITNTTP